VKPDTSREAVERLIANISDKTEAGGFLHWRASSIATLRALLAERDAARAELADVLAENDALRFFLKNALADIAAARRTHEGH
jgi:hypothetical protein